MRRDSAAPYEAFAIAAPGLEPFVARELADLGLHELNTIEGGVEFKASRRQLYEANLHLRTASRVVVRLARFRALTFAELEKHARKVPWERVMARGQRVALRVTCKKSKLYHSGAVAERIARAIAEKCHADVSPVATEEDVSDPGDTGRQLIIVRFDHNHCTVSADSSGALLHLRGYRASVTRAPLRETLAAALVLASEWDRKSPLVDPFCGSGTIPIEAALLSGRVAPGKNRRFRFMNWPDYNATEWTRLVESAIKAETPVDVSIRGSDQAASAIRAAADNAKRAGVTDQVRFEKTDALEARAGAVDGWIVTNPPYGVRLGSTADAKRLIRYFAAHLRDEFPGWKLTLLAPAGTAAIPGLNLSPLMRTTNGGLQVAVFVGRV